MDRTHNSAPYFIQKYKLEIPEIGDLIKGLEGNLNIPTVDTEATISAIVDYCYMVPQCTHLEVLEYLVDNNIITSRCDGIEMMEDIVENYIAPMIPLVNSVVTQIVNFTGIDSGAGDHINYLGIRHDNVLYIQTEKLHF